MYDEVKTIDFSRIAQDLQIRKVQVESVAQLLDEGNTVPFITRYRKERTGGLDEEGIRQVQQRLQQARHLADRKITILKSIENQGKLTDALRGAIVAAETPKRLEDLYLPYKPKKRTLATEARERGLEPLALAIWNADESVADLSAILPTVVNPEKGLHTVEDVQAGVKHLLAELIAETAEFRHAVRMVLWETGRLASTKHESVPDGKGLEYKDYFDFGESARFIPPHRILAINRGERENALRVRIDADEEGKRRALRAKLPGSAHPHADFLHSVAEDALTRLILPSLEREIRRELTDEAESHAVRVFARNLRSLLLQPPLNDRRVLAIDPGFRTGCKLAVLDEHGNLLDHGVMFPHAPQNKKAEAKHQLEEMVRRHQTHVIAIGNGTACRETEEVVSELIADLERGRQNPTAPPPATEVPIPEERPPSPPVDPAMIPEVGSAVASADTFSEPVAPAPAAPIPEPPPLADLSALPPARPELAYVIVNEAGASVYSASAVGREEFPDFDATLRGTISIGRRLQDPLSELVKIDPQNIGVGLYQHDVRAKHLRESLEAVIESSVNHVGIDLNTASVPLLRHVSGLNQLVARELVEFRKQHGPFSSREQLLQVPGVGPARFVQAAGFLKLPRGENPLDLTWIHPESYPVARRFLDELGFTPAQLADREKVECLCEKLNEVSPRDVANRLAIGEPTLLDIMDALARPGRDPREDLPPPIFKKGILKLEDLQTGMELKGTVLNVVDFGVFVDIGLKDSGLVHVSQIANRFIRNPYELVSVGDVVTVWVMQVDQERRRVSLTMVRPGTERKPPERKQVDSGQARSGGRPPRGRRSGPPHGGAHPGSSESRSRSSGPVATPTAPAQAVAGTTPPPAQQRRPPPPSPRKPHRQPPRPKLSKAALEGETPLRTFSELEAFFQQKDQEDVPVQAGAARADSPSSERGPTAS